MVASYGGNRLRGAGMGRGEVKEEGRAQPGPGDMSAGPCTTPAAREARAHEQETPHLLPLPAPLNASKALDRLEMKKP